MCFSLNDQIRLQVGFFSSLGLWVLQIPTTKIFKSDFWKIIQITFHISFFFFFEVQQHWKKSDYVQFKQSLIQNQSCHQLIPYEKCPDTTFKLTLDLFTPIQLLFPLSMATLPTDKLLTDKATTAFVEKELPLSSIAHYIEKNSLPQMTVFTL